MFYIGDTEIRKQEPNKRTVFLSASNNCLFGVSAISPKGGRRCCDEQAHKLGGENWVQCMCQSALFALLVFLREFDTSLQLPRCGPPAIRAIPNAFSVTRFLQTYISSYQDILIF